MIPDWLAGFYTIPRPYEKLSLERGWDVPKHTVDSKYCKVTEIVPDVEYELGFEDRDGEFVTIKMGGAWGWPMPDWDFDEPLLRVIKTNGSLSVKVEKYGGSYTSDVYYSDTKIFSQVGGFFGMKVGTSTVVGAVTPVPPPEPGPAFITKRMTHGCGAVIDYRVGAIPETMIHNHPLPCPYCGESLGVEGVSAVVISTPTVETIKKSLGWIVPLALVGGVLYVGVKKK